MPVCSLVSTVQDGRNGVVSWEARHDGFACYRILAGVHDTGLGRALNMQPTLRFATHNREATGLLGALGRGELTGGHNGIVGLTALHVAIPLDGHFNERDARIAADGPRELYLEDTDVFGTPYHTKHVKEPREPWYTFKRGARKTA